MTHSDIMKISGLELKAGDVIKFDGIHDIVITYVLMITTRQNNNLY